ncbi:MAG TPA: peptidase [Caldithrix sp.]|nr:peptidase [Caldithrix sp.]
MKKLQYLAVILLAVSFLNGCQKKKGEDLQMLKKEIAKFVPTEIRYDASLLNERQKKVVENLYRAAKIVDRIFLDQVYSENLKIRSQLAASKSEKDQLTLQLFDIMFGPFNRLQHDAPFYGTAPKPKGANFYPADMTKEEFQHWIDQHPEQEETFTSEVTVIRRKDGKLIAIPYSTYYRNQLSKAADFLRKAAEYADNPSLKRFLLGRADAFLSNDYYQSDMDWMDLKNHLIEVVIGPYEVYEDGLFNYKASFECFITLRDPLESEKVARFAGYLNEMEKHLPIPDKYKNFSRGSESPIVVAQEVFSAGDTKAGVQTLAFNLPNDERVRKAKGSKKVLLKNMNEAKFEKLLVPIARQVLAEEQMKYVTFAAFFNHVLMHEMSHGIGPGFITVEGRKTEVKKELKETYSTIEECKADVLGMYNNIYMIEKGEYPESFDRQTWATFLAGIFRSIRFGIHEAHGAGNAIIYNYLLEKGGYEFDEATQRVRVNFNRVFQATEDLARTLLTLQAEGNYPGAKSFIGKYAVLSPSMKTLIEKLKDLPVDIKPVFQIEEEMEE